MSVLLAVVWFLTGAIAGWGVRALRAAATMSPAREQMRREIRCWQAETERFKATADRLAQEKESWTAGVRQGRDDVITIVPLLIAAQQRLMTEAPGRGAASTEIDHCA
ncbi:MAG TPA: hypothetical protein VGH77_27960 [Streptosporangiaceae bacterium]|jgi:hypothetical protein